MKCVFLTDLRSKTMTCYTFSVSPTIPESKNVKIPMKKIDEEEMKTFAKKSISTLKSLISVRKKHFGKFFAVDGVSITKLKIDFRKIFVKASLSQNLEILVFDQFFI